MVIDISAEIMIPTPVLPSNRIGKSIFLRFLRFRLDFLFFSPVNSATASPCRDFRTDNAISGIFAGKGIFCTLGGDFFTNFNSRESLHNC
jgi:hypothetical protein